MSAYEQDLERDRDQLQTDQSASTATRALPGRTSASSSLHGPVQPVLSGILMRKATASAVEDNAEVAVEHASRSTGDELSTDLRTRFESSLGTDLSAVRVHTGPESEAATSAVSANAFAVGNDIHFGAGQYEPGTVAGQHLIAHEVAHTVQQRGSAPTRQNKLAVSAAGDALEVEADRAADAMVAGVAASVSGGGTMISRDDKEDGKEDKQDKAEDDKRWAEDARGKVKAVQAAVSGAQERLNADATAAVTGIKQAQASYTTFEKKYNAALERFKSGVAAAQKASQELADHVKFVANTALGALAPQLTAATGAITGVLEKADAIAKLAGAVGALPKAPEKAGESNKEMGPSGKTDWKQLLDTAVSTFESYIKQNKALTDTTTECTKNDGFLDEVIGGKAGDDPRHGARGIAADTMASRADQITSQLGAIAAGAISAPAIAFGAAASQRLDGLDARKIEQDIAIRWMSTLTITSEGFKVEDQTEEIDSARSYLRSLGVEDRLGHDAGGYMTDQDQRMLWMRAKVENEVMQLVGTTGEWLGGQRYGSGGGFSGSIRAGGRTWNAYGFDLAAGGGGAVLIQSYRIAPIPEKAEATAKAMVQFRSLVTLTVSPRGGGVGGGVDDGPKLEPSPP